ncbi:E1-E2 ATPase, partial [Helicosporidium sp. ATCC 50920]
MPLARDTAIDMIPINASTDLESGHGRPGGGPEGDFGMAPGTLFALNENKSVEELRRVGGVEGLAQALCSSPQDGVRDDPGELEQRRSTYGSNCFRQVPGKNFFLLWFENLKDPTIVMLMAAALISTIIGAAVPSEREESAWTEGVAIWVAVAVVSLVGAGNDWQKDRQFRKLNAQKDVIEVSVTRSGRALRVQSPDLVVGDVIALDTGDRVPADAVLIQGHGLSLDEASLTGESEAQGKERGRDPWLRCGTQVVEGSGSALVVAVGEASEWGRTMSLVRAESGDTPLQEKLGVLAAAVGKMGLAVGVLCFFVLLIRWMVEYGGFPLSRFAQGPLQYFIFAVTIVVVAVPEGLPLAVTISLAYSMTRMVRDNNFVRVLAACETMGGATTICSDKTGTLTQNRMTVTAAWIAGRAGGVDFDGAADASDGSASDASAETRA